MNLWEFERRCLRPLPLMCFCSLRREYLVGGHRSNTLNDPIGSHVAPAQKHRSEDPPLRAGRAGRFQGTSREPVRVGDVWRLRCCQLHCYCDSSLGQKMLNVSRLLCLSCQGTASSRALSSVLEPQ